MVTKEVFLQSLFEQLNQNKIEYFVYGSYRFLPKDTGGSDIDMVIEEKKIDQALLIILNIAKLAQVSLVSQYSNSSTVFYRFLTPEWGVQIDIYYKGLCYRGISYYPIDHLRNDIIMHNGIVRVLNEDKGYYVDFFKEIIHNGIAKEKYINALIFEIEKDKNTCKKEITEIYGKNAAKMIYNNLSPEGIKAISKPLQIELEKNVIKGHWGQYVIDRINVILRLFSRRPGYVIVVEGTDGSGKSTIINHITPILNEAFHKYVFYNHLRPKFIPDLGVVLGKKSANEAEHVNSNPHGQSQSGTIGSLIRWGYYMVDYTIGYLVKVWIQIHSKSKVFIFDRYYYDYYIDQKRSRTNLPNWILQIGEKLIAKPDLILCLGGDPKKIYARKPETSILEVERQTNVLKAFCTKHDNAVWIDTTTTINQSCKEAMIAIVNKMDKRFSI